MVKNNEWVWDGALSRQVKGRMQKKKKRRGRTSNRVKQFAYMVSSDRISCIDQEKGK